jgi:uncharacterized protein YcbK (DUF882 family)
MAPRASSPPTPTAQPPPIRRERDQPRRARLRIVIAGDPSRPLRTISLPARLPTIVSVVAGVLVLGTGVLSLWSWKLRGARGALEHRVHAMLQAADSVALGAAPADAAPAGRQGPEGSRPPLRSPSGEIGRFLIESANTGEQINVAIDLGSGEVEPSAYRRLRHVMRCLRTGAETPIDPRLIELLYRIAQRTHQKIVLVSGFRAPMFSLATLSYHTRGMAADIRIPGMTPLMVRDLAESMNVGGVGYYPVSGFVHVDVREDRSRWIDYGENRWDSEKVEHGFAHGKEAVEAEEGSKEDEATAGGAASAAN